MLSTEQKIDLMYLAIAGDKRMGLKGMQERITKVEEIVEDLSWLRHLRSHTVKILTFIALILLPILGTYIGSYVFKLNGGGG